MSVRNTRIHQQGTKPTLSDGSSNRKNKWVKQQFRWIKREKHYNRFSLLQFHHSSLFFNSMVEDIYCRNLIIHAEAVG